VTHPVSRQAPAALDEACSSSVSTEAGRRLGQLFPHGQVGAPSDDDVAGIGTRVAKRAVAMLRRRGKVEDDAVAEVEDDRSMLLPWIAASVQRVGVLGQGAGRTLWRPCRRCDVESVRIAKRRCADVDGFSLHADVCVPARDLRDWNGCAGTWRALRSRARLELLADGRVRYRFKRVWRDGSVAVEFDPIDFVGKLAALCRDRARTWYAIADV
jgi:hypothetical protein